MSNALKSLFSLVAVIAALCLQTSNASADSFGIGDNGSNGTSTSISYDQAQTITQALYRAILFRDAEQDGLDFWVSNILSQQGTDGLLGTAQGIAESEEFYQNIYSQKQAEEIVDNIYVELLHRHAEPDGLEFWSNQMKDGHSGQVLRGIVGSDEFRRNFLLN